MKRRLLLLLGLVSLVVLSLPPVIAWREKGRRSALGLDVFDPSADLLELAVIFEGVDAVSTATAFRGGDVECWYGGGTLDLRGATLDPAGARLRLRSIFGGFDVLVPKSWRVVVHSRGMFGGVADQTDSAGADPSGPMLVIEARSIFGGLSIRAADTAA